VAIVVLVARDYGVRRKTVRFQEVLGLGEEGRTTVITKPEEHEINRRASACFASIGAAWMGCHDVQEDYGIDCNVRFSRKSPYRCMVSCSTKELRILRLCR